MTAAIAIDSDFPGGNIVTESISDDEIRVHQELRDTDIDWFYWYFRVRHADGRTLRFQFTQSRAIGVRGPAYSFDEGWTWSWLNDADIDGNSFAFTFPDDARSVRFSFGMPYMEANWSRFAGELSQNTHFSTHALCPTRKGRSAEYARVGCIDREPVQRAILTCRHHACEMMASYTLEGLTRFIVTNDGDEAAWLRGNVEFLIVPFVDKDGVEDGDQGKARAPRDHGRDYSGTSIYATTAAITEVVPAWAGDRLRVALDMHCPWIAGEHNEVIYLVGSPDNGVAEEQRTFSRVLEGFCRGPLPVDANDYLPYGVAWNTGANTVEGMSFNRWASQIDGVRLSAGIEVPYANVGGSEVNQSTARAFGADLGGALSEYMESIA